MKVIRDAVLALVVLGCLSLTVLRVYEIASYAYLHRHSQKVRAQDALKAAPSPSPPTSDKQNRPEPRLLV
jgi:hypothetical protein